MKEKLLILDFDGTIADTFTFSYDYCRNYIKKHSGKEITQNEFREIIKSNPLAKITEIAGTTVEAFKAEQLANHEFLEQFSKAPLFDHIERYINQWSDDHVLVVISSSLAKKFLPVLEREEIDTKFAMFLGAEVDIQKQPKIRMAMEELKFKKEDILFITDTVGDIKEAQDVGVPTVAVTWGFHSKEDLEEIKPDHIVDTPEQLNDLIMS